MGGTMISAEIRINPASANSEQRLQNKFNRLRKECEVQYGTDPYNGTWSTIDRVVVRHYPNAPKRWTNKAKRAAYEWMEEQCDKWEAIAIPANGCYLMVGFAAT